MNHSNLKLFLWFFHSQCLTLNKHIQACQEIGPNDQNQEEIQGIESDQQVTHLLLDINFKMTMITMSKKKRGQQEEFH